MTLHFSDVFELCVSSNHPFLLTWLGNWKDLKLEHKVFITRKQPMFFLHNIIRMFINSILVRRRHHGQLRLPDQRLVDLGSSPSGRVRQALERVRSRCQGPDQARRRGHPPEEDLAAARIRKALSPSSRLQGKTTKFHSFILTIKP